MGGGGIIVTFRVVRPGKASVAARRWTRYLVNLPVRLVTEGPAQSVIVKGEASDLNVGGVAVRANVALPVGAQVAVEFTLPLIGEAAKLRGFVRNRQGFTYGLEFITENDTDYENVARIESFIKEMELLDSDGR